MTKTVKDLMRQGLITCPPTASLGEVAALLTKHHIHALVVAEQADKPLGIISDFDLLAGEWLSVDNASLSAMKELTAGELMTAPLNTIDANTSIKEASQSMLDKQVHRLAVMENDVPVGIISISDFVAHLAMAGKPNRNTVGDVMSDAFLVCRDKTSIISAARTITQAGWRSVVVVDSRGRLLDIVSGIDLLQYAGAGVDENLTVSDVIVNRSPATIDINASLQQAADIMVQNHLHRIVVIDKDDPESFPLGVISSIDIVAEMAKPDSVWQS
jgi:CBS domain-containing protein